MFLPEEIPRKIDVSLSLDDLCVDDVDLTDIIQLELDDSELPDIKDVVEEFLNADNANSASQITVSQNDPSSASEKTPSPTVHVTRENPSVARPTGESSTSTGTRRRTRSSFTDQQILRLEGAFQANAYPNGLFKIELAGSLNLTEKQVGMWFQNRRMKKKKTEKISKVHSSSVLGNNRASHNVAGPFHQTPYERLVPKYPNRQSRIIDPSIFPTPPSVSPSPPRLAFYLSQFTSKTPDDHPSETLPVTLNTTNTKNMCGSRVIFNTIDKNSSVRPQFTFNPHGKNFSSQPQTMVNPFFFL